MCQGEAMYHDRRGQATMRVSPQLPPLFMIMYGSIALLEDRTLCDIPRAWDGFMQE